MPMGDHVGLFLGGVSDKAKGNMDRRGQISILCISPPRAAKLKNKDLPSKE